MSKLDKVLHTAKEAIIAAVTVPAAASTTAHADPRVNEVKHHVALADHYLALSEAADDFATFEFYHQLALHHLEKAREHEADGIFIERRINERHKTST